MLKHSGGKPLGGAEGDGTDGGRERPGGRLQNSVGIPLTNKQEGHKDLKGIPQTKALINSSHRPYYGQVTMSADVYPASSHMMGPPDVYPPSAYLPRAPNEQHTNNNNYLPSVSYSLDHLDRLEYQVTSLPLRSAPSHPVGLKVLNVPQIPGSGIVALPAKLRELPDRMLQLRRGGAGQPLQTGEDWECFCPKAKTGNHSNIQSWNDSIPRSLTEII